MREIHVDSRVWEQVAIHVRMIQALNYPIIARLLARGRGEYPVMEGFDGFEWASHVVRHEEPVLHWAPVDGCWVWIKLAVHKDSRTTTAGNYNTDVFMLILGDVPAKATSLHFVQTNNTP